MAHVAVGYACERSHDICVVNGRGTDKSPQQAIDLIRLNVRQQRGGFPLHICGIFHARTRVDVSKLSQGQEIQYEIAYR